VLVSLVATLAAYAAAEVLVRAAGVQPRDWPASAQETFAGVRVDPLLGPLPRPGWSGAWQSGFEVAIDARGFRATGFPSPERPSGRVAFLGDSCTFGWGLGTGETYVARLDALQRGAGPGPWLDLVNAAYPGDSAVGGFYKLRERALPLAPDLVVLAFSANNAFRLTLQSDAERYRLFDLRNLAFRSRLFHVLAARAAGEVEVHPRDRKAIGQAPIDGLRRVAARGEFESALRSSVTEARRAGARVLFLLLPRAVQVSDAYGGEDAARSHRELPLFVGFDASRATDRELALLEASCLAPGLAGLAELRRSIDTWRPLRSGLVPVRERLQEGAARFVEGDLAAAAERFAEALRLDPDSPLALYGLGVVEILEGDASAGLERLERADALACNVFLAYQVALWRLAVELDVPVVDVLLLFQAHDGEPLYLDPAHPNPPGNELIAEALWPRVRELASPGAARGRDWSRTD
jgi:lysophospholipase L1-like esterase